MKLKTLAAFVLGAGALVWLAAGHHPTNPEGAGAEGATNNGWNIQQKQDKLTDQITTEAEKIYPVDGGSKIVAVAQCLEPVGERKSWQLPMGGHPINGIEFEFDYFAANDDEAKQPESSFEHAQDTSVIEVYRLDSGAVKTFPSVTKYKNQAILPFPTPDVAKEINSIHSWEVFDGNTPTTLSVTEQLIKAQLLRVRLPLAGGQTADIEIHAADLHELFAACPATKALLESPAASNSGEAQAAAQPASTDQSAPDADAFKTTDWTKELPANKQMHSELFGAGTKAGVQINDYDPSTYPKETASVTPPATPPASPGVPAAANNAPPVMAPVSKAPSINCEAPNKSTIDVLVCSSPQLVSTDAQINAAYYQLRHSLDQDAATSLKEYQKDWLAKRGEKCGLKLGDISAEESARLVSCLQDLYTNRLNALQAQLQKPQ